MARYRGSLGTGVFGVQVDTEGHPTYDGRRWEFGSLDKYTLRPPYSRRRVRVSLGDGGGGARCGASALG